MAATGYEFPLLSQLKRLKDWVVDQGYLKSVPVASQMAVGGIKSAPTTTPTGSNETYLVGVNGDSVGNVLVPHAGTGNAGLMSAADKAKLDALPDSFTAPAVDVVATNAHSVGYAKDTLEIVCDSSGRVTAMYFIKA